MAWSLFITPSLYSDWRRPGASAEGEGNLYSAVQPHCCHGARCSDAYGESIDDWWIGRFQSRKHVSFQEAHLPAEVGVALYAEVAPDYQW